MKHLLTARQIIQQIPYNVRRFLLKSLVVFILWKVVYHLILLPIRLPDKKLTQLTAQSTAFFYGYIMKANAYSKEGANVAGSYSSSIIYVDGVKAIGIADPCNGLELYILYVGFLLCVPQKITMKLYYIVFGILGIFVLNIFRCVGIGWLNLYMVSLANFAHHYFFKMIIYGVIFYTWVQFSKRYFNAG